MKFGMAKYEQFLNDRINDLNNQPLKIAVTGSSGQGKSSLINTIRGLKADSDGAAKVDSVECTKNVTEYPDPNHPNLIYYDLPGVGTPNFSRDEYFNIIKKQTYDSVGFEDFDFFLILSADRFTEDDVWLAKYINKHGREFYFIRTKVDNDLRSSAEDYPDSYNEENILETIRNNYLEQLHKLNLGKTGSRDIDRSKRIFLLSAKFAHSTKWDFPHMITSLLEDYPITKRESIIISITSNCEAIIRKKVDVLRSRIWMFALGGGLGGAIPIPGVSVIADQAMVKAALYIYKENLGLDDESLKKLAASSNVAFQAIIKKLISSAVYSAYFIGSESTKYVIAHGSEDTLKTVTKHLIGDGSEEILKAVTKHLIGDGSEQTLKVLLKEVTKVSPIIGTVVGSSLGFGATYYQLHQMLNDLEQATFDVMTYVTKASSKQKRYRDEL
ncbi:unnamed protein product [Adineta steineri]|nr:unnamed protein product [Adineta steineri]